MKRIYRSALAIGLALVIVTAGCATATPSPTPAPVQTAAGAAASMVTASATVVPAQLSELAFVIAAPVKQINVAAGQQVKAGQALIALDTPQLEADVAAAQAELASAQLDESLQSSTRQYQVWNGRKWIWTHGLPEVKAKASARVEQAQGALDLAKAKLAQGTLVAPFDGTVVSVDIQPGEMVQPNKSIAVIGDLSHLQVETTDLSEREIAQVHLGQTSTVRLKAFQQDLSGKVSAIAPMSNEYNGDTVYKVTIQLDQQPPDLLWGMSGDVDIKTK